MHVYFQILLYVQKFMWVESVKIVEPNALGKCPQHSCKLSVTPCKSPLTWHHICIKSNRVIERLPSRLITQFIYSKAP